MHRVLPHPILTVLIVLVYCLLVNEISLNALAMGLILGIGIPILTRPYWPARDLNIGILGLVSYVLLVIWDILVANVHVAWIVLTRPNARMRTRWVRIPLDLTRPQAITILAGTITLTPGTVSADLSADGRTLLVHALDTDNPDDEAAGIKSRYERRLKEIFE